jgi:hypothetical protein
MRLMNKYRVIIVTRAEGEVIHTFPATSKRVAETVEIGVNKTLDHKNYYTEIELATNYEEDEE